jgi:hypothetical protein
MVKTGSDMVRVLEDPDIEMPKPTKVAAAPSYKVQEHHFSL